MSYTWRGRFVGHRVNYYWLGLLQQLSGAPAPG